MGRKCLVPECLSEEGRDEDRGVTFHKIPLHSDIRPKWMSLCHIPEDKYSIKVVHVCSRHFLKVDFCSFKGKKYMLRQGVLPSVFPWSILKHEQMDFDSTDATQVHDDSTDFELKSEGKDQPTNLNDDPVDGNEHNSNDSSVSMPSTSLEVSVSKMAEPNQSSTTIEQRGKSIQTSSGLLNFAINTRLEALHVNNAWIPARIIEIDYEENEVFIRFEKFCNKYDEWISMNSSRLRPLQQSVPKKVAVEAFAVGEKCMASWSDARKFPARVTRVIDKDTYEVVFNDGLFKVLKGHRMVKADGKSVGSAPLFDPAEGTKQERRDRKRKINVAQLFGKRSRTEIAEEAGLVASPSVPTSSTSAPAAVDDGVASPVEEPEYVMPKWENGRPVGVDSTIETNDGVKKSVIVPDSRLPPNWEKHLTQRVNGASVGKWDTLLVSPEGRRFRTRAEIKLYLEENPQLNHTDNMFNFSLQKRARTRRRVAHAPELRALSEPPLPEPVSIAPPKVNPNSLKIPLVDDVYKCPIEGCGKNFRRENLAQMHVKHYHPKYTKYLDSTPNVADLAYARTVGESLDKSPERALQPTPRRPAQKISTPKTATSKVTTAVPSPTIETENKAPQTSEQQLHQLQKTKDSEILKLLNSKPQEDLVPPKYPPGLPSSMYPDIKLKDLLNKSEGIPNRDDLNLKTLSASTTRPSGIKTLLPVVRDKRERESGSEKNQFTDGDAWGRVNKSNPFRQHVKRRRHVSDNVEASKLRENTEALMGSSSLVAIKQEAPGQAESSSGYIVEGDRVIKIVQMRSEEIINCTCGITEEDGLMIQCELCLCWQHAYCNNIARENEVPDKYICYICQNPLKQRSSRKYYHDQDWLKNGTLPVASYHCKDSEVLKKRFEKLKKTHDLTGGLHELKDFMHSLKVKIGIAEAKNHPKLYLWSKQWDKHPLPEKSETTPAEKADTKPPCADTQLTKADLDLLTSKTESHNDSMLLSILKSAKDEHKFKDDLDLNSLMENNLEQLPPMQAPIVPQPEAAIDSADCKLNLLDHIAHSHTLIEERLNDFEAQVDVLEGGAGAQSDADLTRTCQTVQMLLRDLGTLNELSHSNSL